MSLANHYFSPSRSVPCEGGSCERLDFRDNKRSRDVVFLSKLSLTLNAPSKQPVHQFANWTQVADCCRETLLASLYPCSGSISIILNLRRLLPLLCHASGRGRFRSAQRDSVVVVVVVV